jgi:[acyl-carrier-protein] S-malonyltransferase
MGKIAFAFAGQGAQYPGMGKTLYEESPAARAVFRMADKVRPGTSEQCFSATKEELAQTINTQPCLFTMDLACAKALLAAGVKPEGAAGFSLGEVAAAAFCGMTTEEDGFRLVMKRAEYMDGCAKASGGSMVAILKLESSLVETLCEKTGTFPVNYNCPGQLVAAGSAENMQRLATLVSENGGRAIPLAVSGAFHSLYMKEAAEKLGLDLAGMELKTPSIPLYANVTAEPYGENAAELLSMQIDHPVLWQKTIERMIADGFDAFVEVGAGKTLSSLIKKISGEVIICNVEDADSLQAAVAILKERA